MPQRARRSERRVYPSSTTWLRLDGRIVDIALLLVVRDLFVSQSGSPEN
jgi:hypothetical protein